MKPLKHNELRQIYGGCSLGNQLERVLEFRECAQRLFMEGFATGFIVWRGEKDITINNKTIRITRENLGDAIVNLCLVHLLKNID